MNKSFVVSLLVIALTSAKDRDVFAFMCPPVSKITEKVVDEFFNEICWRGGLCD